MFLTVCDREEKYRWQSARKIGAAATAQGACALNNDTLCVATAQPAAVVCFSNVAADQDSARQALVVDLETAALPPSMGGISNTLRTQSYSFGWDQCNPGNRVPPAITRVKSLDAAAVALPQTGSILLLNPFKNAKAAVSKLPLIRMFGDAAPADAFASGDASVVKHLPQWMGGTTSTCAQRAPLAAA